MDLKLAFARQFGNPRGPLGHLVGRLMATGNADLNRWVVESLGRRLDRDGVARIAELGPGPGVGLAALLTTFPRAQVWGIDRSSTVLHHAQRRNQAAVRARRLHLLHADTAQAPQFAPLDLIVAVHVLYFWSDPVAELTCLREALAPGGPLAIGYQLRTNMPALSQAQFPRAGATLYDADQDVHTVLTTAGFAVNDILIKGPVEAPHGRLALATPETT